MLHLDSDALGVLRYMTLDAEPEALATSLYGPTWREALRFDDERASWRTRRDPLPAYVADFLGEILTGAIAHDGRSTRETTRSGWWVKTAAGNWSSASLDEITQGLHRLVLALCTEAVDSHTEAERRKRASAASGSAREAEAAWREVRSTSLRVALLSALGHLVAAHGRSIAAAFIALRARLPIPEETLRTIAERWLFNALDFEGLTPTPAGRISVADVRDVYERQARSGDVLPLQTLYRALDSLLGARIRRVEWTLPPSFSEGDQPA